MNIRPHWPGHRQGESPKKPAEPSALWHSVELGVVLAIIMDFIVIAFCFRVVTALAGEFRHVLELLLPGY